MPEFEIRSREKVVFIGDSITDCGRQLDFAPLGNGYVQLVSALVTAKYPDRSIQWLNKGISGETVQRLVARWTPDVVQERPDWISIAIGINNVASDYSANKDPKTAAEEFEACYEKILDRAHEETSAHLILSETFFVAHEDRYRRAYDIAPYNQVIRKLAKRHKTLLIQLESLFRRASTKTSNSVWTTEDGVHPNMNGHALIALGFLAKLNW